MKLVICLLVTLLIITAAGCNNKKETATETTTEATTITTTQATALQQTTESVKEKRQLSEVYEEAVYNSMINGTQLSLADFNIIEEDIINNKTENTIQSLYIFYKDYLYTLRRNKEFSYINTALNNYFTLTEKLYVDKNIVTLNLDELNDITMLDAYYTELLVYINSDDIFFIQAFEKLKNYYDSYATLATAQNDALYETNMKLYRLYSKNVEFQIMLFEKDPKAIEFMQSCIDKAEEPGIETNITTLELLKDNPQSAANYADNFYNLIIKSYTEPKIYSDIIGKDLDWYYTLNRHGVLKSETITKFAESLKTKAGVFILETSEKSEKSGFMPLDKVATLNGEKIYSLHQFQTNIINSQNPTIDIEVVRDGETVLVHADRSDNSIGVALAFMVE